MESWIKGAWLVLAAVHLAPAAVLFKPGLVQRLYGVSPDGPAGVLLVHRGALFLAIVAASLAGAFDPGARRACSLVVGLSVLGYLLVYLRAGLPSGSLRTVALVDLGALPPLALVAARAWSSTP